MARVQLIFLIVATVALFSAEHVLARKMDQCQIARELVKHGMPRHQLADWVCLTLAESSGNTAAIGRLNQDGSTDYGLFQINNRYWCANGYRGKECNIDCNALLNDDISDDVKCAKKIYSIHGFNAWVAWVNKCRGRAPSVNHCL